MPQEVKKVSKKTTEKAKSSGSSQPVLSIGLVGHVDHGKTTLVSKLSGKWTDTHSEEIKRGITIRLGYATAKFPSRTVSFIDAPGHESLMATMLSGAAIMDAAILLVAANETCPQPQTKEHIIALEIIGCKNIIIAQNKIDLVSKEGALKNYQEIKTFVKGTIAENAPIIPISAQHGTNIDVLINAIEEYFPTPPKKDLNKDPLFFIARSFDVNRPGAKIKDLHGGVLGGALKQGTLAKGQEIEIRPGISLEKEGKKVYKPVRTKIVGLMSGDAPVNEIVPGGSAGVETMLDPFYVKSDSLTGGVVGAPGKLPEVREELMLKPVLLERVVGAKDEMKVEPIKKLESLMLNVNAAATVGVVAEMRKDMLHLKLKIPVCCFKEDRITISRMVGNRWRLIGYGTITQ